jgi:hypothetical protein
MQVFSFSRDNRMTHMPSPLKRRTVSLSQALQYVLSMALLALPASTPLPAQAKARAQTVQAPVLKWQRGGCSSSGCQTGWYASPAIADLDADGAPEVIWAAYDLVALNGADGSLKWRAANTQRVWPAIAVGDLNGDGSLEIVTGRSGNQVVAYSATGQVLWTRNPFSSGHEVRTLALSDLDSDGTLEVIVGRAGSGDTLQLNVFQASGTVRQGWPARRSGEPGYGWGMYNQNIAVGDIDGDGDQELIGPTDTHYITALDDAGNQLPANSIYNNYTPRGPKVWSQVGVHVDHAVDLRGYANCGTEHRPNFANAAPVIDDLDADGAREIIVLGDVYNCAIEDGPAGDLYVIPWILKADRSRWKSAQFDWTVLPAPAPNARPLSEDYSVIENNVHNAVTADLDGDGVKEILYPSYDGRLHAYWLDKTQHGAWPFKVPGTGIRFAAEPTVADLDGDGKAEVIFTSWPQKAGNSVGQLHILNDQGVQLHAVNLPAAFPAGQYNGGLAAPTLANIDGDADLEAVIGTVKSGAVAFDLPGTANAQVRWGTARGSQLRAGGPAQAACYRLTLSVIPATAGSIEASPPTCATGTGYTPGSTIVVTATAAVSTHVLIGWGGIGGSTNPAQFSINSDKTVSAVFRTFTPQSDLRLPIVRR